MATAPVCPSRIFPGCWQNVSQIDTPRPSSCTAPSIWYADVATPQWNPSGNRGNGGLITR